MTSEPQQPMTGPETTTSPPSHGRVGFPFRWAAPAVLVALLATPGGAQDLRLTDLFDEPPAKSAESPPPRDFPGTGEQFDPAHVDGYLRTLEALARDGEWEALRDATELLIPWMDMETGGFDEILWQRARAYEAMENREAMLELTRLYLGNFPEGKRRGWFLLRAARISQERTNHRDAEQLWRTIAEERAVLEPDEAIEGARYLLRRGGPRAARMLLAGIALDEVPAAPAVQRDAIELFIESLLILDDPERPIPGAELPLQPETVRLHVRRAALFAVRHEAAEAEELASMLLAGWTRRMVVPERELCEEILRGPGTGYWPPNRSHSDRSGGLAETNRESNRPTTESTRQP